MSTCRVLEEANSIAEKIAIFNQSDENPYHLIAKKISEKKIKHIVCQSEKIITIVAY